VSISSTKPYLLRAIYEWCVDQGFTPHLSVAVDGRTSVPRAFVKDGQIVLNIGQEASHQLHMGNEFITFAARFGGVAENLSIPVERVAAIYARENGHGMAFDVEESPALEAGGDSPEREPAEEDMTKSGAAAEKPASGSRPHLVRIK
jgi:stringent starvation protein B